MARTPKVRRSLEPEAIGAAQRKHLMQAAVRLANSRSGRLLHRECRAACREAGINPDYPGVTAVFHDAYTSARRQISAGLPVTYSKPSKGRYGQEAPEDSDGSA